LSRRPRCPPLHRRPLPARQGHRPDGRGRQPHPHGSGKQARGNREPRPRIIQLKIEEMALAKETDQASKDRLGACAKNWPTLNSNRRTDHALAERARQDRGRRQDQGSSSTLRAANWNRRSAPAICQGRRAVLWPHPRSGKAAGRSRGRQPERDAARGSDADDIAASSANGPAFRSTGCWRASARSC
jgi:hypothetical protein